MVGRLCSKIYLLCSVQGNEPMSTEYNGYSSSLKLTVSAPYVHRFSPSKWSHNGLKRCAYGADTVSFSNERCPSYPVYIGPFPCAADYASLLCSLNYQQNSFSTETVIILPENSLALCATLAPRVERVGFARVAVCLL